MNDGARLIFGATRLDHVTPLLRQLHWLRAGEIISFKMASLAFQCVHGTTPNNMSADLRRVADVSGRYHLRSASSMELFVPGTRLSTIGDRALPDAAARIWNSLRTSVVTAEEIA